MDLLETNDRRINLKVIDAVLSDSLEQKRETSQFISTGISWCWNMDTMSHAFLIYWKWLWLSLIFVIVVIVITIIMSTIKILVTNSLMQSTELNALTFAI